jgi:hypothetical protein
MIDVWESFDDGTRVWITFFCEWWIVLTCMQQWGWPFGISRISMPISLSKSCPSSINMWPSGMLLFTCLAAVHLWYYAQHWIDVTSRAHEVLGSINISSYIGASCHFFPSSPCYWTSKICLICQRWYQAMIQTMPGTRAMTLIRSLSSQGPMPPRENSWTYVVTNLIMSNWNSRSPQYRHSKHYSLNFSDCVKTIVPSRQTTRF